MIDLNSKSKLNEMINGSFTMQIDNALLKYYAKEENRKYLGGSRLGVDCSRALQYEYLNVPKDKGKEFPARVLRVFQRGHWAEEYLIKLIREAGFTLLTEQPDGKQYGFTAMDGKLKGHVDGIFTAGPIFIKYPALWECKCIQEKDFKACVKHGVKKHYPVYYGQIQIYQAYMQLHENPAIFTAVNANTMELHFELVDFDAAIAQRLSDKAVRVIKASESGEFLPRISNDKTFYKCKFCSWSERCFTQI